MARGYGRQIERLLRDAGCTFVRFGKGDHEIWHSPITDRHFVFDRSVRVRHTANGFLWDKAFGTFYDKASDRPRKSATVINLGYTPEVAEVYPYVAQLSGGVATDHPRERVRQKAGAGG